MPTFAFQARDSRGARIEGTRDAPDQNQALTALREAGFFVTKLAPLANSSGKSLVPPQVVLPQVVPRAASPVASQVKAPTSSQVTAPNSAQATEQTARSGEAGFEYSNVFVAPGEVKNQASQAQPGNEPLSSPVAGGVTPPASGQDLWAHANAKELSLFYRQMHSMLGAGTSVSRALQVYAEHASNRSLKRAALQMSRDTAEGCPLSQAMRSFPGLFSVLAVSMIGAGERGGRLDQSCESLAVYSERDFELNQAVKRETFYPKLLLVCAILIPSVVTWFLNGFAAYLHQVVPPFIFIGVLYVGFRVFSRIMLVTGRDGPFRLALDAFKMHVPGVNKVVRSLATAKFARALSAMYASGVGAEYAMKVSGESCGNAYVQRRVMQVAPALTQGASFTESMVRTGQFPPIAIQMMATGEESGAIDTQLNKVADFLEVEAEAAIRNAVKIMGVLVFLMMAAYIGHLAIGVFSGYANEISDLTK